MFARIKSRIKLNYNTKVLLGSIALIIVLSLLSLSVDAEHLTLLGFTLPKICFMQLVTDAGCPFCGITRSLHLCIKGNLQDALNINFMGVILFCIVIIQIPLRIAILYLPRMKKIDTRKFDSLICSVFLYIALIRWGILLVLTSCKIS